MLTRTKQPDLRAIGSRFDVSLLPQQLERIVSSEKIFSATDSLVDHVIDFLDHYPASLAARPSAS